MSESVSVTAETPLLETAAVSSGRVIDNRSMSELPVLSNSPARLSKFTPGVQSTGTNRYFWNANVIRDIRTHEGLKFQFRMDVINVFNRSEWAPPNLDPFSTDFGKVTRVTVAQKRYIQVQGGIQF